MKEKELFVKPEAEVIRFPKQDIVTTSGEEEGPVTGGGNGIVMPDHNW